MPSVPEFWWGEWGTYGLEAISQGKKSAIADVDYAASTRRHCTDSALSMTSSSCLPFSIQRHAYKGTARSLRAYIAVSPQIHCNPSTFHTCNKSCQCFSMTPSLTRIHLASWLTFPTYQNTTIIQVISLRNHNISPQNQSGSLK